MATKIKKSDFVDNMSGDGDLYYQPFSRKGAAALYDYLQGCVGEISEDIIYDPWEVRGLYTEYKNISDVKSDYSWISSLDHLCNQTPVIEFSGGLIIANI